VSAEAARKATRRPSTSRSRTRLSREAVLRAGLEIASSMTSRDFDTGLRRIIDSHAEALSGRAVEIDSADDQTNPQ